jgi:hypothetical protein
MSVNFCQQKTMETKGFLREEKEWTWESVGGKKRGRTERGWREKELLLGRLRK